MRYYETNFYRWEQPLIDELRSRGYFVYHLRDTEDGHYQVEKRVYVNNIGFVVTDEELDLSSGFMRDYELESRGTESPAIADEIRVISDSISDRLAKVKAEYEQKAPDREKAWKEVLKIQENRMERDRHYNLSLRKDNPVYLQDGFSIMFQTIYDNGNGTQEVMYFIRDNNGKIAVDSTKVTFNLNARYSRMAREIAKKHGLTA